MTFSEEHDYEFGVIKSSWGVKVWLSARRGERGTSEGFPIARVGDLSLSSLLQRTLADFEVAEMRKALEYVKRSVVNSQDADCSIVLTRLEYVETDFQSDGIRAAFIGWAADEFGFPVPEIRVRFVKSDNRYVFDWAALG